MAEYHDPFHRPPWDQEDAEALRAFLKSQTGKRLIFRLQNDRPSPPAAKDARHSVESNALWAREAVGYETAVRNLFDYLLRPVADTQLATLYPSLDDDAHWDDSGSATAGKTAQQKVPNEAEIDLANPPQPER